MPINRVKLNRTLRYLLYAVTVSGILFALGFAKRTDDVAFHEPPNLGAFAAENDTLSILREYADDISTLRLKLLQLEYINVQRAKDHQPALKYDLLAGRVMAAHLAEQTRERTFAHKNLAGELCFHRWAHTGRTDHVRENLYAVFTGAPIERGNEDETFLMHRAVDAFLAEQPPEDGHKRTLLDPFATHVGIAFEQSSDNRSWRYGELYVNKYVDLAPIPHEMSNGDTLKLRITFDKPGIGPYCFLAYWSPGLIPPTRKEQFTAHSYTEATDVVPIKEWPWDFAGYVPNDQTASVYIPLHHIKPGILYGILYIRDHIESIPYHGGKATTEGTIPAAGVVIEIK